MNKSARHPGFNNIEDFKKYLRYIMPNYIVIGRPEIISEIKEAYDWDDRYKFVSEEWMPENKIYVFNEDQLKKELEEYLLTPIEPDISYKDYFTDMKHNMFELYTNSIIRIDGDK